MANARTKPKEKGRPLKRPSITRAERKTIHRWLTFKAREAQRTLQSWIDVGPQGDSKYYEGQKTFYRHRVAAYKWAASTLPKERELES